MNRDARERQMKTERVRITYRGRRLEISPEASARINKLARESGRSVESTVTELLEKAAPAGGSFFMPVRC